VERRIVSGWRRRGSAGAPGQELSVDSAVEAVQLRQRVEVLRAWRNLLLSLVPLAGAICWLLIPKRPPLAATLLTSVVTAVAGVLFARLLDARRGRDDFYRDVITLTSVFYQSPATIREFLGMESIERSISNLLKAALQSDELGAAYWQQSVKPFIDSGERGFKEDWRYSIDMRDLPGPVEAELGAGQRVRFESEDYRRLTTSLVYRQTVLEPAEIYWVACAFDPDTLPSWFRDPNFLLRELLPLPEDVRHLLRQALPQTYPRAWPLLRWVGRGKRRRDHDRRCEIAREIFDAKVRIGGEELVADRVYVEDRGIRWGFTMSLELQKSLRRSLEISVEVRMLQARTQNYFPVVINTPTRHPTIHFNYAMCPKLASVESEVFFSAERPYDDHLRIVSAENRRIEIQTQREDWVLAGSGCVFVWEES
jgi:hypothetical protein